ncbi:MAG: hypothetical protein HOV79_32885 [Hamadaea sp.]|nr:hypothetical protein [Hamadaea sp.]
MALIDGQPRVFEVYQRAAAERRPVMVPATALFAANKQVKLSEQTWAPVFMEPNVAVMELSQSSALRAGDFADDMVTAQVSLEAADTGGFIITERPDDYRPLLRTWSW